MPVSHYVPEDHCLSHGDQHSERNVELNVFILYHYTALRRMIQVGRLLERCNVYKTMVNKIHVQSLKSFDISAV